MLVDARQGMATTNNERFLREWHEVSPCKIGFNLKSEEDTIGQYKWFPYNKGGAFRKWYGNNELVINFYNKGEEICEYIDSHSKVNHKGRVINRDKYFLPNITWSALCKKISLRYTPQGSEHAKHKRKQKRNHKSLHHAHETD